MEKFKYLIKRIKKLNYKRMFKVINEIHIKTNKNRIFLFFDTIYCGLKYQAGYLDYQLFEMYNLNRKQRKTILTRGINNHFVKTYNDKNYSKYFDNKVLFNTKFNKFLKRDWLDLNNSTLDDFNKFIKDKDEIMIKPINGTHGDGIRKVKTKDLDYNKLKEEKNIFLEEVVKQLPEMNKLNPSCINTIRVITLYENNKCNVVIAYIRIGNNKIVDNFNGGGMTAPVNVDNHKIEFPAIDKKGNLFYKHPTTKLDIVGFEVPQFKEIEKLVSEASKVVKEVKYVGWDVALSVNGPCLIEGNDYPGHDIYQLPPHRKDGIGVLPQFQKYLKK